MPEKEINVVAGVLVNNGRILIARRKVGKSMAGKWEFPGGKVEKDEPLVDALQRELKEEFGDVFEIGEYIGANKHSYDNFEIVLHAFFVKCEREGLESTDHDNLQWVSVETLRAYDLAGADIPFVDILIQLEFKSRAIS